MNATSWLASFLAMLSAGMLHAGSQSILTVRGHAVSSQVSGVPNGGNFINQVSINAWLNADGTADGVMEWTWDNQSLPGNGGQGNSGAPWTMFVDAIYVVDEHSVIVFGAVVNAGQNPGEVGSYASFLVTDNGNGADDPPDELDGLPIEAGNFTIK